MDYTYEEIAKMIDHSMLNPVLTDGDLGVTRVGATRTAEMLDECRRRLGLA